MQKKQNDTYTGDAITSNIKYADNEWQAHGTVDRGTMFLNEPLLGLLYAGKKYDKDIGDYKDYVPRGSMATTEGLDANATALARAKFNIEPARLSHDLLLLDATYYVSTSNSSLVNIFDVDTYIKKAISVANPLYDDHTNYKVIHLIDPEKVDENLTVLQFLEKVHPKAYTGDGTVSRDDLGVVLDRYSILKGDENFILTGDTTVKEFLSHRDEDTLMGQAAKTFYEDFTLHEHDPLSIRNPFDVRSEERRQYYLSRFLANTVSHSLGVSETGLGYYEILNNMIEDATFHSYGADSDTWPQRVFRAEDLQWSPENAYVWTSSLVGDDNEHLPIVDDDSTKDNKYIGIFRRFLSSKASRANYKEYLRRMNLAISSISKYCIDVYVDWDTSDPTSIRDSWGIHLLNEESTTNLFQDNSHNYRLFNTAALGYKLADALISLRTFLGGFYHMFSAVGDEAEAETYVIPYDTPIYERIVNTTPIGSLCNKNVDWNGSGENPFYRQKTYITIDTLNTLYRIGHGKEAEVARSEAYQSSYTFEDEIKEWLSTETLMIKTPVYGDYVEELNFMQDLNPDSDVNFSNLRIKKTSIPYKNAQDSKYEEPFMMRTNPLINREKDNEKGFGVHASEALAAVGDNPDKLNWGDENKKTTHVIPPFLYDFDKEDEEQFLEEDERYVGPKGSKQRVANPRGNSVIESRIESPTIDELWTFLKYLTEADGNVNDSNRLPSFFGIDKNFIKDSLISKEDFRNTVNPMASEDNNRKVIDILNWHIIPDTELPPYFSPDNEEYKELRLGGYEVTEYIDKIYDYEVRPFSRRVSKKDGDKYEYDTEAQFDESIEGKYSNSLDYATGYLEKLYNETIANFALYNALEGNENLSNAAEIVSIFEDENYDDYFNAEVDKLIKTPTSERKLPYAQSQWSNQRVKAFTLLSRILNYHKADGENDLVDGKDTSYHNHYKHYMNHPKNLKSIERDLEAIRQNLQSLAEFALATFSSMGYADRSTNRGTLHQLHRNSFDFNSTLIGTDKFNGPISLADLNNTIEDEPNALYNFSVAVYKGDDLANSLNNLVEPKVEGKLLVSAMDRKVVYEDGEFAERYKETVYDHNIIDLRGPTVNSRALKERYSPNETVLSEVYLAADGTWRSIHEHPVAPILDCEF